MGTRTNTKQVQRTRRHARIRARISGTSDRPRLALFKSNRSVYAQLVDDVAGVTLASVSSEEVKAGTPKERAKATGALLAKKAQEKKVAKVVFDRGGFLYQGKVKAFAEGAREGGLEF